MCVTGYILAGGKGSRFGADKARALLHGVPLLVRVADTLRLSCDDVFAVADAADKYADLDIPTITDLQSGKGPVAGLEAALAHQISRDGHGWVTLSSCDMAGLKDAWTKVILERIPAADAQAALAITYRGDFWQPFPAAFHTQLLPTVSRALQTGRASFQRLLTDLGASTVSVPVPADWPTMPQVNTPDDLARFEQESQ